MTVLTQDPSTQVASNSAGPTLGRLVNGELLKLRTTSLWWILGLCALVATVLALLLNGFLAHDEIFQAKHPPDFAQEFFGGQVPSQQELADAEANWRADHVLSDILVRSAANIFTSGQFFGLMIVMLFGALMVTNEYHHQTATTTFLGAPRRERVIAAKVAAAAIVAAIVWLVTTVLDLGVGTIFFSTEHESNSLDVSTVQRAIGMNLPAYMLWALLGLGLGALIRHQIASTLIGTGLYLIGGQIAQLIFILVYTLWIKADWVMQAMVALPAMASTVMISANRVAVWTTEDGSAIYAPPWWVGALVLIGYGIIATGIGTLFIRKRDIS